MLVWKTGTKFIYTRYNLSNEAPHNVGSLIAEIISCIFSLLLPPVLLRRRAGRTRREDHYLQHAVLRRTVRGNTLLACPSALSPAHLDGRGRPLRPLWPQGPGLPFWRHDDRRLYHLYG